MRPESDTGREILAGNVFGSQSFGRRDRLRDSRERGKPQVPGSVSSASGRGLLLRVLAADRTVAACRFDLLGRVPENVLHDLGRMLAEKG